MTQVKLAFILGTVLRGVDRVVAIGNAGARLT